MPVSVRVEVKRVEVVFPADGTRLEARVEATDRDLDLAVLSVSGSDLPFLPLGDSDALLPGQPVQVIGFPFGRAVEVGRPVTAETVPQPTVTRGSIGALRAGGEGDARYIQTDAAVHPGSSGGPMLDEKGHAVGVIRMRLRERATTIGPGLRHPHQPREGFPGVQQPRACLPAPAACASVRCSPWTGSGSASGLPETFDDSSPSRAARGVGAAAGGRR